MLKVDPELIEQVMINIVKNAIQALEEKADKQIKLSARLDNKNSVTVKIKDNGSGIDEEALSKILFLSLLPKRTAAV